MEFSHTGNDDLFALAIDSDLESGVFTGELAESLLELSSIPFVGGFNRKTDDGSRNENVTTRDFIILCFIIGDGISSGTFETEESEDVSSTDFTYIFHFG
jgi:hypothetical protein